MTPRPKRVVQDEECAGCGSATPHLEYWSGRDSGGGTAQPGWYCLFCWSTSYGNRHMSGYPSDTDDEVLRHMAQAFNLLLIEIRRPRARKGKKA